MKKVLLALAILVSGFVYATPPDVNEKIEKSFKEAFPKAQSVSWYKAENHYQVLFVNEMVNCRMWYSKAGKVVRTERYYKESELCPFMLSKIKAKYDGKRIFGITEVNNEEGVNYYFALEDDKQWYHVKGDSAGNFYMYKKYNKA